MVAGMVLLACSMPSAGSRLVLLTIHRWPHLNGAMYYVRDGLVHMHQHCIMPKGAHLRVRRDNPACWLSGVSQF